MTQNTKNYLVTGRSKNTKTGNLPQVLVGRTKKEALQSCIDADCPLLQEKLGGTGAYKKLKKRPCYFWGGTGGFAAIAMFKAAARNKNYTIENAIKNSVRAAKFVRMAMGGDPSSIPKDEARALTITIRAAGLRWLGYLHGWRLAPWWKDALRASCHTLEDAREALKGGWHIAYTLPEDTPIDKGVFYLTLEDGTQEKGIICPEQRGKRVDCNSCGLCPFAFRVEKKIKAIKIIGFISHR